MGIEFITAWIKVRRYDQLECISDEVSESPPLPIDLQQDSSFVSIKTQVRMWLGLPEENEVVMKLRRNDGFFITFSSLLSGSTESEPFILDIARVHQTTPASARTPFSPSYVETVRSKFKCLEKRVEHVETLIPELRTRRQASIENMLHELGSKVNFLDRRLDELLPLEWKAKMQ
ncbi:hypothetical protein L9F63_012121 [Diploptera punctata]|uniref:Uncharacterized protein n=1 Tax=Diploptera punctata TaxID=6984 RepID=A0AAD8ADS6_DIPPU|nr:hypothetical protein L9F63_012121 [Diploptera punctata]